MKVIAVILILTLAITGSSIWMQRYLFRSSELLAGHLEELEQAIANESWEEAYEVLNETWETWETIKTYWAPLIDHNEIDTIELTIARMTQYIHGQQLPLAQAELAAAKFLVRHIPEKEQLNLQNIF